MIKQSTTLLAFALTLSALAPPAFPAHGGSYRGPGDTVPPGGGGSGNGSAPGVPTGGFPGQPVGGTGTGVPGPRGGVPTPGGSSSGGIGTTGFGGESELTSWQHWWGHNQAPFLNLKAAIYGTIGSEHEAEFVGRERTPKLSLRPSDAAIRGTIVPALLAALEKEESNDIVTGALIALARIGDVANEDGSSPFEAVFTRFLASSNQEIAETAAIALGILANDASVDVLGALLRDDDRARRELVHATEVPYRTRAFAAYGLGLVGARTNQEAVRQRIASILVGVLADMRFATRDVHVACITALGLTSLAPAGADADKGGPDASREGQLRYLLALAQDEARNPLVRAHAPTALARLCTKDGKSTTATLRTEIQTALLAFVSEHSKTPTVVQESAVLALGELADVDDDALDAAVRARLAVIVDEGKGLQVRAFATLALAEIGGRHGSGSGSARAVGELRAFLGTRMTSRSSQLRPWSGLAVGLLERRLADHSGGTPPSAGQKESLRTALAAARTPEEIGAFAIAAGIARDADARRALETQFDEVMEQITRGHVAVALGLLGDRAPMPKIQAVVRDSKYKPDLLKQTAIALGLLGDKELVPELCGMLSNAKGLSAQAAIASALGFIGDARSVDPLVGMLKREEGITDSARGFAAVALGLVADKELLPWNAKIAVGIHYRANTTTLTGENGTGVLDIL